MGNAQMATEQHSAAYSLPGPATGKEEREQDWKWELKGWGKDS